MTTAILTANVGYPPDIAQRFIENLRQVGYQGHVQFFDFEPTDLPVGVHRLYEYRKFLRAHPDRFTTIILTDLRDVLFQSDPALIPHGELDCFLEWEGISIGQCPYNSSWIRTGFGENEFMLLKENPISCCGFIVGSQRGIDNYLEKVLSVIENTQQFSYGADQGVHNWLIHKKLIPHTLHANETGPVYTVGHVPGILVKNHRILQKN